VSDFIPLTGVAAPLDEANVDTDVIFPARFLLLLDKAGLGAQLFYERRHTNEPFVLDVPPFDKARILIAGRNFGAGSSRELAVWALADFGIRAVIAPSFGEIFFNNCFKNGVLPIVLSEAQVERLQALAATGAPFSIDLEAGCIHLPDSGEIAFSPDPYRRRLLLLGLDEIGAILADDVADIERFEAAQAEARPWLHLGRDKLATLDDLKLELAAEIERNE